LCSAFAIEYYLKRFPLWQLANYSAILALASICFKNVGISSPHPIITPGIGVSPTPLLKERDAESSIKRI